MKEALLLILGHQFRSFVVRLVYALAGALAGANLPPAG